MLHKPTIDDYIGAILDRDNSVSYPKVLDRYDLTPDQFFRAVKRIDKLAEYSSGRIKRTLDKIASDEARQTELFNMGEEFIKEQYNQLAQGKINHLYAGTRLHPQNIKELIYYALISENPKLRYKNRKKIIEGIKKLPKNLKKYFSKRKLRGLIAIVGDSALNIIKEFDKAYQEKTGAASLFALEEKYHLHEWGDQFNAPSAYWHNQTNVEKAIYHTLTERHPGLKSRDRKDRKKAIQAIKRLPNDLFNYFKTFGLGGLMICAFEKEKQNSPLAVLEVFDRIYMKETGDKSLFDLTHAFHLHKWGDCFHATATYWEKRANESKSVYYDRLEEAIYHTLTERKPKLLSKNRKKVMQEIRKLPVKYMCRIGLKSFVYSMYRNGKSPNTEVCKIFERFYRKKAA